MCSFQKKCHCVGVEASEGEEGVEVVDEGVEEVKESGWLDTQFDFLTSKSIMSGNPTICCLIRPFCYFPPFPPPTIFVSYAPLTSTILQMIVDACQQ